MPPFPAKTPQKSYYLLRALVVKKSFGCGQRLL